MLEAVEKVSVAKGVGLVELWERTKKERLERLGLVRRHVSFPRQPVDVELLAQEVGWCFECGDDLLQDTESGEYVCVGCGLVWGNHADEARIPFEESSAESGHSENQYSPEGNLDFGKNLGSKLDTNGVADILDRTAEDMPAEFRLKLEDDLLVRQLTGETISVTSNQFRDPFTWSRSRRMRVPLTLPLIQEFLTYGSELCNKHGLHGKRNENHARFANELGANLRLVGKHYANNKNELWADRWKIAAAVFCLLYREMYPDKYNDLRSLKDAGEKYPEFSIEDDVLTFFDKLLRSL